MNRLESLGSPLGLQRTVEEVLEEELSTKSVGKLKLWEGSQVPTPPVGVLPDTQIL